MEFLKGISSSNGSDGNCNGTQRAEDGFHCAALDRMIAQGVQMCPFLRNIGDPTNFSFLPSSRFSSPVKRKQGPIFEDGPNFERAFKLFHGRNGVVPLCQGSQRGAEEERAQDFEALGVRFHPLAASAAAISLSALGAAGPFGFDAFMSRKVNMQNKMKQKSGRKEELSKKKEQPTERKPSSMDHQALSNEWLQTGNCPIAKSFRAVSGVLPLVAKIIQPPAGMKLRCPPAIVAARAAIARTAAVRALRPQPLPARLLAVGMLGMALNVPLGIWREHTEKFSPAWFTAVHASVPFIAMLRKAVHIPKYAMAYTIAASMLGQVIGSRAERRRMELACTKVSEVSMKNGVLSPVETSMKKVSTPISREKLEITLANACGKGEWNLSTEPSRSVDPLSAF